MGRVAGVASNQTTWAPVHGSFEVVSWSDGPNAERAEWDGSPGWLRTKRRGHRCMGPSRSSAGATARTLNAQNGTGRRGGFEPSDVGTGAWVLRGRQLERRPER